GVLGDELQGVLEGEDCPEGADGPPAIMVGVPVEDLELALVAGAEPGDGHGIVFPDQGIAPRILAHVDTASVLMIECLNPALDKIEDDRSAAPFEGAGGRTLGLWDASARGILRFHGGRLLRASSVDASLRARLPLGFPSSPDRGHHTQTDPQTRGVSGGSVRWVSSLLGSTW